MKFSNAFMAGYANQTTNGLWIADAFPGYWGPAPLPGTVETVLVLVCELEPSEVGKPMTFDVSLRAPDGSVESIGQFQGTATSNPSQPNDIPFAFEVFYPRVSANVRMTGLHWFDVRASDGTACQIRLWVQST